MLKGMNSLVAAAMALLSCAPNLVSATNPVYAHFMVGIVQNYAVADWKNDMQQAQAIGIDGFALNCAPSRVDNYTPKQLANAYAAAQSLNFKVFISFDFAYWTSGEDNAEMISILNTYSPNSAQATFNGGAIVSTFVGDSFNWNPIKSAVSTKLFVIPNLQDPAEWSGDKNNGIDGAFSWYAWPTDGGNSVDPGPMNTIWDDRYVQDLAGKPYMAPVSPWFSTHFNTKNWVFICEELPTQRWDEILVMKPQLVEIISWNDFGESHYIAGSEPNHSDDGSSQWAAGFPHDGWRTLYAPYIAAYKSGSTTPVVTTDELVYWYRTTPHVITCSNDSLPIPRGSEMLHDLVFASTLLTAPAQLTVKSGSNAAVTVNAPAGITTFNFTMGLGSQTFSVSRNGKQLFGGTSPKTITNSCVTYNFNAYVGTF